MSLLPHHNYDNGLTVNAVDTYNSVAPAPNPISLSDCTPTMHPRVSNYTSMPPKPPNIPNIPHHTKPYLLSKAPLSNSKYCDTSDPTKPSSPPIPICP